jgi:hypothetical protein
MRGKGTKGRSFAWPKWKSNNWVELMRLAYHKCKINSRHGLSREEMRGMESFQSLAMKRLV